MPETTPELDSAVQEWWINREPKGGMVLKWFLVAEALDDEGDVWLEYSWSPGLRTWEQKGMLHEALDSQVAIQVADEVKED